jgi:hypothetical protein
MLAFVLPPTFANSKDGALSVQILRAESWATRHEDNLVLFVGRRL